MLSKIEAAHNYSHAQSLFDEAKKIREIQPQIGPDEAMKYLREIMIADGGKFIHHEVKTFFDDWARNDKGVIEESLYISPDMAARWIELDNILNDRKHNKGWVTDLSLTMANGLFHPEVSGLMMIASAGYILDGQHRLMAMVEAQKGYAFTVRKNIDGALSVHLDQHRERSVSDQLSHYHIKSEAHKQALVNMIMSKSVHHKNGREGSQVIKFTKDERRESLLANLETLDELLFVGRQKLSHVPATSSAASVWRMSQAFPRKLIAEFFRQLADPQGLGTNHIVYTIIKKCNTDGAGSYAKTRAELNSNNWREHMYREIKKAIYCYAAGVDSTQWNGVGLPPVNKTLSRKEREEITLRYGSVEPYELDASHIHPQRFIKRQDC